MVQKVVGFIYLFGLLATGKCIKLLPFANHRRVRQLMERMGYVFYIAVQNMVGL